MMLAVLFTLYSCNEDVSELSPTTGEPNPSYLSLSSDQFNTVFASIDDFREIAETFVRQNPDFTSYNDHFSQIEEDLAKMDRTNSLPFTSASEIADRYDLTLVSENNSYELKPKVMSNALRSLLNKDAVIEIEGTLYQFKEVSALAIPIESVVDPTDLTSSPDVRTIPFLQRTDEFTTKGLEGICNDEYEWENSDHRLRPRWYDDKVEFKDDISGIFVKARDCNIEIKHQKKGAFGIWFANKEDRIRASGEWTVFVSSFDPPDLVFVNESCSDCSKLARSIAIQPINNIDRDRSDWIISPSLVDHRSEDGDARAGCIISE